MIHQQDSKLGQSCESSVLGSSTRTIRLDESLDKLVVKSAAEDNSSLNSFVNKALRTYLEWNVVSKKFGLATVPRSLLNKLIEHHNESECKELGGWMARESFKPFTEYQFGSLTMQSSVEVFRRFGSYGGLYEFDEMHDSRKQVLFLKHESGRKWSIYYSGLIGFVFKDLLNRNVKTEITDELCISQIDLVG